MSSPLGAPPPSLQLHPRHPSSRRHSPRLLHPLFFIIPGQHPHRTLLPPRALSRRFFLPSASFLWDAIAGGSSASEASSAVRRGMLLFRQGDVGGSLAEFDRAIELDPRQKSYLWQRGLSLYYLNRFDEGAEQFRIDVAENPNDTEESIWCFLCEAQLYGVEEARSKFLQVGRDPRPFMREAYNMFKDGGDPEKLVSMFSNGQGGEFFYASLYAGLYYESQNDPDSSKRHILAACASPYGVSKADKMMLISCSLRSSVPVTTWLLLLESTAFAETGCPVNDQLATPSSRRFVFPGTDTPKREVEKFRFWIKSTGKKIYHLAQRHDCCSHRNREYCPGKDNMFNCT